MTTLSTAFFQIVMIQWNLRIFFSSGYSEIVSLNEMYIITKTSSYTDSPDIYPCFLPQESEIAHALFKGI